MPLPDHHVLAWTIMGVLRYTAVIVGGYRVFELPQRSATRFVLPEDTVELPSDLEDRRGPFQKTDRIVVC